jgi:hypothetical protein
MKHFFTLRRGAPLVKLLLVLLVLAGPAARAQAPTWQTALAVGQASGSSSVNDVAAAANGDLYLIGNFNGTISFGATSLTSAGTKNMFIAKWSQASASFVWVQQAGGSGFDDARAVAVNGTSVYVVGSFSSPIAQFGSSALTNAGDNDVFVAKLIDSGGTGSFV